MQAPLVGKISLNINNVTDAIDDNAAILGLLEENTSNAAISYRRVSAVLFLSLFPLVESLLSREYQVVIIQMVFRPVACRTMITSLLSHSQILILIIGSCAAVTTVSGDYPH